MKEVRGVLLDIDGVLYVDGIPIQGADEALAALQAAQIPFRLITNTSTRPPAAISAKLEGLGLQVPTEHLFSALNATVHYLKRRRHQRVALLVDPAVRPMFAEFTLDETAPQAVIVGDIGDAWSYQLLNRVFNWLLSGAELVAIHKNRFWQTQAGLQMDIGAFITGLEYAASVEAMVMGKPSPAFFLGACESLGLSPDQVCVVGDDIDSDVQGAQSVGCLGVLVETGKYRAEYAATRAVTPDRQIRSIAELPALLKTLA